MILVVDFRQVGLERTPVVTIHFFQPFLDPVEKYHLRECSIREHVGGGAEVVLSTAFLSGSPPSRFALERQRACWPLAVFVAAFLRQQCVHKHRDPMELVSLAPRVFTAQIQPEGVHCILPASSEEGLKKK